MKKILTIVVTLVIFASPLFTISQAVAGVGCFKEKRQVRKTEKAKNENPSQANSSAYIGAVDALYFCQKTKPKW